MHLVDILRYKSFLGVPYVMIFHLNWLLLPNTKWIMTKVSVKDENIFDFGGVYVVDTIFFSFEIYGKSE